MSHYLSRTVGTSPNLGFTLFSGIVGTLLAVTLTKIILYSPSQKIILSPRDTLLPKLSREEQVVLPYPPDTYPGGRDVQSSYGTFRVYEFGSESGRKVLLLHGISTPSPILHPLSALLTSWGCRVMLFDLPGRGYSDSPPFPHNSHLYTTIILLALASSPLSWTPSGFSIIGYSFGGGIAVDFAGYFPQLVKSLVVLAPSGLIRQDKIDWGTKILYSPLFPECFLEWIVRRRLTGTTVTPPHQQTGSPENPNTGSEVKGNRDPSFENAEFQPGKTIASVMQWQLESHAGFLRSFCSSIKHGSLSGCEDAWRKLQRERVNVLVVVGNNDSVIVGGELREDLKKLMGTVEGEIDGVRWKEVEGGHELIVTAVEDVGKELGEFWELQG